MARSRVVDRLEPDARHGGGRMLGHRATALAQRLHYELILVKFERTPLGARSHVVGVMDDVEQSLARGLWSDFRPAGRSRGER